jgi:AcrR family transcriptional regulator
VFVGQVKKATVRDAILKSAFRLFTRRRYHGAKLSDIAKGAGVSPATVYVYFRSKLDIVFAIYTPWLRKRLETLERDAARITDPRKRVRRIVNVLWREIPTEHNGFANTVIQAVSAATPEERYDPALLHWTEAKIGAMLNEALLTAGISRDDVASITHAMVMAFDGFATNVLLNPDAKCSAAIVNAFSSLLLNERTAKASRPRRKVRPAKTRQSAAIQDRL